VYAQYHVVLSRGCTVSDKDAGHVAHRHPGGSSTGRSLRRLGDDCLTAAWAVHLARQSPVYNPAFHEHFRSYLKAVSITPDDEWLTGLVCKLVLIGF
jgi:hypothetical protein